MKAYTTRSGQETMALARRVARRLRGGDILLLQGELGAGKTTFVKGLALALGIKEKIQSPTFVLIRVHNVKRPAASGKRLGANTKRYTLYAIRFFVHADAYRVKRARELREVGLTDWLGRPDTITVVEWGEKIKSLLQGRQYTLIKFEHGKQEQERTVEIAR